MKRLKFGLAIAALVLVAGCRSKADITADARRTLEAQGFAVSSLTYRFWATNCGKDDGYQVDFVATSPTGAHVTGSVCSGVWKGNTVRFN